ncbi:TIGR03986 family type III CRISPR-associated RAMP protein [Anaerolentibacter hominis]|uniref:TIGR03986 family type III CRISPR-associated RAMP protein n=1 Tax=Anaerolentibacter hominis TaxID=3079009 RepID=UPI0031B85795
MKYFTNPYNFVPLEEECKRSSLVLGAEEHFTGFFECELEILTPLFIPNTSNSKALCSAAEAEKGYCGYEFSSYEDLSEQTLRGEDGYTLPPKDPIIPGSAIRGAVRSVYEAAFNGCMSTMRTDTVLGRRSSLPKKPGVLKEESGKWFLYPCKRAMLNVPEKIQYSQEDASGKSRNDFGKQMDLKVYESLEEGQEIWIRLSKEGYRKKNGPFLKTKVVENFCFPEKNKDIPEGFILGWIHKGEPFGRKKHHESVFYELDEKNRRHIDDDDFKTLQRVIEHYQQNGKTLKKMLYPKFSVNPIQTLIYYSDDRNVPLYLSPSCIGKELYNKTLKTILDENGAYQPCENVSHLCSACKVFGMITQENEKKGALGSRVRFTDAQLENKIHTENLDEYYMRPLVLPESGEPRPGAVEFYTESPYIDKKKSGWNSEGYWTYDYICIKKEDKVTKKKLPSNMPKLRGRKFYWHSDSWRLLNRDNLLDNEMKQRVRPLLPDDLGKKRTKFCFNVYFDRLNWEELERLRWSLDFADSTCAHKIGRGKALGFGSARISVREMKIRQFSEATGAWELIDENEKLHNLGNSISINSEAISTLKLMTGADKGLHPTDVCYPKIDERKENESFRWFAENKRNQDSKKMQPAFTKILPKAMEEIGPHKNQEKRLNTQAK